MKPIDAPQILVLDAGTSSVRAVRYALDGTILGSCRRELTQYYPAPGWVEHDAAEIWRHALACAREVVAAAGEGQRIAAIGITNQRETVVAWDRISGEPLCPAIVWQDRRTAALCEKLRAAGHEPDVQRRTGLRLDPYFSATKMRWLLDEVPEVGAAGDRLAFGTVESWLCWKLSGEHLSDVTNASRTLLLTLDGADWDEDLLRLFGVPRQTLPRVVGNAGRLALTSAEHLGYETPITALVGDQQSATIGQGCLERGDTKATLGTGAFALTNVGDKVPEDVGRLLTTILYEVDGQRTYALEGAVFVAGSLIQWLRDNLGLLNSSAETETLARSVGDNGGVYLLPALSGLGAPYWRPDATAAIVGLTFASTRAHVARAALETVSYQLVDLAAAFQERGADWQQLRLDGGMSANDWLAQDIADMTSLAVTRPFDVETTARGAAILAAVGAGLHASLATACATMATAHDDFVPQAAAENREMRLGHWRTLVSAAL